MVDLNQRQNLGARLSDALFPDFVRQMLYYTIYQGYLGQIPIKISGWSIMHGLTGMLTADILLRYRADKSDKSDKFDSNLFYQLLLIHTAWEVIQKICLEKTRYSHEWLLDTILDTIFFMAGALLLFYLQ